MGTMPVVAVQEDGECIGALARVLIGAGVGPFSQGGLDEALGLAVSFGRIGLGADVLEAEAAAGVTEGEGPVARAVVGQPLGDVGAFLGFRDNLRSVQAAAMSAFNFLLVIVIVGIYLSTTRWKEQVDQ